MGRLVEISHTYELSDALCVRSYLEAHGIYTLLQNEHHIVMSGSLLNVALGGYRIVVSSDDAREAKSLLHEVSMEARCLEEDFDETLLS